MRRLVTGISAMMISGCCSVEHPCIRNVPPEDVAQIKRAMRDNGFPPVKAMAHLPSDPPRTYDVKAVRGRHCEVRYVRGKWEVREHVLVYD